ncbi:NEDD4 family-interacting protein 1 [Camelus dromedarius]|uniref:NEDD4 family-interacting protein 1 n=1 Tax=Camelus dromedarius TaxID=9838 RepID=A0A5N4C911_CAMDR|nr:NEDD4 family-interacting protein 1 [Camelus dromedarius]
MVSSRYQQLQNEEESGEPQQAEGDAPPPYSSISAESAAYFDYRGESGFPKPPSYNVATTLPSYDEAERTLWYLEEMRILWVGVILMILTR